MTLALAILFAATAGVAMLIDALTRRTRTRRPRIRITIYLDDNRKCECGEHLLPEECGMCWRCLLSPKRRAAARQGKVEA